MQVAGSTTAPCARAERRADPPGPPPPVRAGAAATPTLLAQPWRLREVSRFPSAHGWEARERFTPDRALARHGARVPLAESLRAPGLHPGRPRRLVHSQDRESRLGGAPPQERTPASCRLCFPMAVAPESLSFWMKLSFVHVTSACSQVTLAVRSSPSVTSPLHPSPPSALRSPRLCFSVILSPSTREESRAESGAGNASPRTWEDGRREYISAQHCGQALT